MKKITFLKFTTFLLLLFSAASMYSQSTLSATASCPASDFDVTNFYLADVNGAPLDNNCTPGTPQTAYIYATFTGVDRYSLYIEYDLYINNVFTGTTSKDCLFTGTTIATGTPQKITPSGITWNCGDLLEIKHIYMSWQTYGGRNNCGPNSPKCYGNTGGFVVKTPLIANFSTAVVCDTSFSVNFTDSSTGGNSNSPYTYSWAYTDDLTFPYTGRVPFSTIKNPTYTLMTVLLF